MTQTTIRVQMQQRADTAANWTAENPSLRRGEIGYEYDTGRIKIGDGTNAWNSQSYVDGFGADFLTNPQTLSIDSTIPINTNAAALGPSYTIGTGVTLTVSTGSFFRLI